MRSPADSQLFPSFSHSSHKTKPILERLLLASRGHPIWRAACLGSWPKLPVPNLGAPNPRCPWGLDPDPPHHPIIKQVKLRFYKCLPQVNFLIFFVIFKFFKFSLKNYFVKIWIILNNQGIIRIFWFWKCAKYIKDQYSKVSQPKKVKCPNEKKD